MKPLLIFITAAAALAGCSHGGGDANVAVPRRHAYPRPQLPDTSMVTVPGAPLRFDVNAAATVTAPREGWLDVAYPSLGITLHTSFTPTSPQGVGEVMENRLERIMLNSGNRSPQWREWTNRAGFAVAVATTEGSATPVQFVATDSCRWVVSGAAYFSRPGDAAGVDSLRPVISAIERDVLAAFDSLAPLK